MSKTISEIRDAFAKDFGQFKLVGRIIEHNGMSFIKARPKNNRLTNRRSYYYCVEHHKIGTNFSSFDTIPLPHL